MQQVNRIMSGYYQIQKKKNDIFYFNLRAC